MPTESPLRLASSRGQAMVETALILPLVLLVVLGGVEFNRIAAANSTVLHASQEAARYGQVNGSYNNPQIRQTFITVARQGSVAVGSTQVSLTYYDSANSVVIGSDSGTGYVAASPCPVSAPQTCDSPQPGDYLSVTGSVPWSAADPLIGAFLNNGFALVKTTTIRIED